MISLALISGLFVSPRRRRPRSTGDRGSDRQRRAVVNGDRPFSQQVGDKIAKVPGVSAVHRVRQSPARSTTTRSTLAGRRPTARRRPDHHQVRPPARLAGRTAGDAAIPRNLAASSTSRSARSSPHHDHRQANPAEDRRDHRPEPPAQRRRPRLPPSSELGGGGTDNTLYLEVADGTDFGAVRQAGRSAARTTRRWLCGTSRRTRRPAQSDQRRARLVARCSGSPS